MRDAWLPLGLVVLVGAAAPLACGQPFELSGSTGTGGKSSAVTAGSAGGGGDAATTGTGGALTTSVGSSTSTGTIGTPCANDAECATPNDTLCGAGRCVQKACVFKVLQPDGPSFSQLYGDCHIVKCAHADLVSEDSTSDVYDDGNECTDDTCNNGVHENKPKAGSDCGANGICNDSGACVQCTASDVSKCEGSKQLCLGGYCSGVSCVSMLKDGNETDKDCGGSDCGPCDAGLRCNGASDCKSKVCALPAPNAPEKLCLIAICSDGVKNGEETDIDCGGSGCPLSSKCDDTKHCAVAGDCKSGVCQAGVCKQASCTDGVKNGMEIGIDCGGGGAGCAPKCPPG